MRVGLGARGDSSRAATTISAMAKASSRRPAPDAAQTSKTRRPRASSSAATMSAMSLPSGTSTLLRATRRGAGPRGRRSAASSASMTSRSESGSRPGSSVAQSRTCTRAAQRSTWRRKSWPRPWPSLAPSIRPGTSATVKRDVTGGDDAQVGDQGGERVVGDLGPRRGDRGDQADDLPALGKPTRPMSATNLSSRTYVELVAGLAEQREAGRLALGGGQRGVAEAAAAAGGDDHRRAVRRRGRRGRRRRSDLTTVPSGTGRTRSLPFSPLRWSPAPWPPLVGRAAAGCGGSRAGW